MSSEKKEDMITSIEQVEGASDSETTPEVITEITEGPQTQHGSDLRVSPTSHGREEGNSGISFQTLLEKLTELAEVLELSDTVSIGSLANDDSHDWEDDDTDYSFAATLQRLLMLDESQPQTGSESSEVSPEVRELIREIEEVSEAPEIDYDYLEILLERVSEIGESFWL